MKQLHDEEKTLRLLLDEFGPEIEHRVCVTKMVVDSFSRLDMVSEEIFKGLDKNYYIKFKSMNHTWVLSLLHEKNYFFTNVR